MRISDWSSDVCSSDLAPPRATPDCPDRFPTLWQRNHQWIAILFHPCALPPSAYPPLQQKRRGFQYHDSRPHGAREHRSEEHTSELQSLMRISYAVFCLKNKNKQNIK